MLLAYSTIIHEEKQQMSVILLKLIPHTLSHLFSWSVESTEMASSEHENTTIEDMQPEGTQLPVRDTEK